MTLAKTFYEHVSVLMKSGDAVLSDMNPHKARIMHVTFGLEGELRELFNAFDNCDYTNLIEELGDLEFYIAEALMALNKTESDLPEFDREAYEGGNLTLPCVIDITKKYVIYGKDLDVDGYLQYIAYLFSEMEYCRRTYLLDVSRESTMLNNISKLSKRYPSGYTNAAAIARADKGE